MSTGRLCKVRPEPPTVSPLISRPRRNRRCSRCRPDLLGCREGRESSYRHRRIGSEDSRLHKRTRQRRRLRRRYLGRSRVCINRIRHSPDRRRRRLRSGRRDKTRDRCGCCGGSGRLGRGGSRSVDFVQVGLAYVWVK